MIAQHSSTGRDMPIKIHLRSIGHPALHYSYNSWPYESLPSGCAQMKCRRYGWQSLAVFLLLIMGLSIASGPASAEWVALESRYQSPGLQTFYVDPATMSREDGFVTVWQLTDFVWTQGGQGFSFRSTTTQQQVDCGAQQVRLLRFAEFSGATGQGTRLYGLVDSTSWLSINHATSLSQALWVLACGNS